MRSMVIGVAGGTGSGKSTLTARLKERFGPAVSILNHDSYYRRQTELPLSARTRGNYDHPDAFETERMVADLRRLRAGEGVDCPVYDFTVYDRAGETVRVEPTQVIIVEGILVFESRELRELMDMKIFVDTDADVRILRRILRDVKQRGRSLDSVITQYLTTVKPMHDQFVEPSKRFADIIVPEGGENRVALEMIVQRIRSHMEEGSE